MNRLLCASLAAAMLLTAGCPKKGQVTPPAQDAQQALDQAISDLEAKRFRLAQDRFTFIVFNFPGSRQASDAQYYLAEAYFRSKDYTQAQNEYDFYIKSYPNGRFQEDATYKLALSYLRSAPGHVRDQSRALKAREIVEEFIETYPESPLRDQAEQLRGEVDERLAMKEFDAARLYFTNGEYRSALAYYDYIAKTYPAARWQGPDRYQSAVCHLETGDTSGARAMLVDIVSGDYPNPLRQQARQRLSRLGTPPVTAAVVVDTVTLPVDTTPTPAETAVTPALSLLEPVHFETNRADITGDERAVVSRNAALLCAHPEALVTLVGHCDPRGSDAYNDTLGMMRAEATERALVSAGVPAERLKTESAGERQTVAATPDEYWQDRRVEFILK